MIDEIVQAYDEHRQRLRHQIECRAPGSIITYRELVVAALEHAINPFLRPRRPWRIEHELDDESCQVMFVITNGEIRGFVRHIYKDGELQGASVDDLMDIANDFFEHIHIPFDD